MLAYGSYEDYGRQAATPPLLAGSFLTGPFVFDRPERETTRRVAIHTPHWRLAPVRLDFDSLAPTAT